MKKLRLLLFALLAIAGISPTWADTVTQTDYTVDFNTPIAVPANNHTEPIFQVVSNWTRIADRKVGDNYYGTAGYYMLYKYSTTDGVGGTGALLAQAQQAPQNTYDGTIETTNDYIVTPKVSGTVTLKVKASTLAGTSTPSGISIYKVDDNATTVDSTPLEVTYSDELNTASYVTATISLAEASRLAIRAQWVYLDDFAASSAEIVLESKLTVAAVTKATDESTVYYEQQPDGSLLVQLNVTLTNNGDVDFTTGTTENYTLSILQDYYGTKSATFGSFAIPVDLAVGETSDPFLVSINVPAESVSSLRTWGNWYVVENVSSTQSSSYVYAGITAYESKFVFREGSSSSTSSLSAASWGTIMESTTKTYAIFNNGTAPLVVNSITLPTGFTSADLPALPITVNKGESQTFSITQDATAKGLFAGDLVINYTNALASEPTEYTLPLSVNVISANTFVADFNGDGSSSSPTYPAGSVAEGGINSSYTGTSGNYDVHLVGYTYSSYATENNKFVTPKVHAEAGEALSFDVKAQYSSTNDYFVKVYVSTDRKTWGEPVAYYTYTDSEEKGSEGIGSSFVSKSITFDTEGDYYVAFALFGNGSGVDNIVGLEKTELPAHEVYFKKVTLPTQTKAATEVSANVEIIPLTDEDADNYTVSYYVDGAVVATAEATALAATAKNSKTFEFKYTPTDEATTTHTTYIAFTFADGTVAQTEVQELNVVVEATFSFITPSTYVGVWDAPTSVSSPIEFGKTSELNQSKNYRIYNWGSAPLTINSIELPEGFTAVVSKDGEAFDIATSTIAIKDSVSIDIVFSATEAGTYEGELVINHSGSIIEDSRGKQGAANPFTLVISGTRLDPTLFYANFGSESNQWPAGSVYQNNVSTTYVNSGNYAITSSSTTNNLFVTPKLTAEAGDKIAFDAKLYSSSWSEGKIVVYAAATREEVLNNDEETATRVELFSVSGQDEENPLTTDYQTLEVTIPEAGEYYLGFEISGRPYVDDIYGLKVADVAHDWALQSSNIPTTAMQNVKTTVTVNVANLGIKDEAAEDIEVIAYVNGEVAATTQGIDIPMAHQLTAAGTQLSVAYHSPKAGTFPVYIEVKAGDYSIATDPVDVTFDEETATAEGLQVGEQTSTDRDYGFVDWYMNDGSITRYTDILYPAAKIEAAGIQAGDKIASITFKASNSAKTFKAVVTSWVGTSTGDITYGSPDKAGMQEISVYNGSVDFAANAESVITLTEPIVWDGTSDIRIYTEAVGQGSQQWMSANYGYDTSITMSYNGTKKAAPVAYFTLAVEPAVLSGRVRIENETGEGSVIYGATVTLVSTDGDNIQYEGKTNGQGQYSINVIQSSRTYNVTAVYPGYEPKTVENVSDFATPINFLLNELETVELADDSEGITPKENVNVVITRTLKEGWNAIVLPISLTAEEIEDQFGEAEVAEFVGDEPTEDGKAIVKFRKTDAIKANVPYLLWLAYEPAVPTFINKDIEVAEAVTEGENFNFVGVYEKTGIEAGDYFVKDGKFLRATQDNKVLPFRAYLQAKDGAEVASFRIGDEDILTAINGIVAERSAKGIYNLAGQRVSKAQKGIYVVNGKKVVVK